METIWAFHCFFSPNRRRRRQWNRVNIKKSIGNVAVLCRKKNCYCWCCCNIIYNCPIYAFFYCRTMVHNSIELVHSFRLFAERIVVQLILFLFLIKVSIVCARRRWRLYRIECSLRAQSGDSLEPEGHYTDQ